MNHLQTFYLLDLAEEVKALSEEYLSPKYSPASVRKLAQIDAELLSRIPEGEFVTLLDEDGKPVGFEPECYVRLAEAQIELLDADWTAGQLIGLDLGV